MIKNNLNTINISNIAQNQQPPLVNSSSSANPTSGGLNNGNLLSATTSSALNPSGTVLQTFQTPNASMNTTATSPPQLSSITSTNSSLNNNIKTRFNTSKSVWTKSDTPETKFYTSDKKQKYMNFVMRKAGGGFEKQN